MAFASALPDTQLVLDTCTLTAWRYGQPRIQAEIRDYIRKHEGVRPALTSTTVFETLHGFEKKSERSGKTTEQDKTDLDATKLFIREAGPVLPFDEVAAGIAAYVFPRLTRSERNKHWCDLLIAATAVAHGYGVASADREDLQLIGDKLSGEHPILYLAIWKPS